MSNNQHLVPELIKNIAWKLNPNNKIVTVNERWMAEQQLNTIIEYCSKAVAAFNTKRK